MAREKEHFRDNLTLLKEKFGDVAVIPIKQAAPLLGVAVSTIVADKRFPTKRIGYRHYVPIVELASWLS